MNARFPIPLPETSLFVHFAKALAVTVLMSACKGPAGIDGEDAVLADSLAPNISWIEPDAEAVIDSFVRLKVHARDDQSVWRLTFYVAGFEFPGDSAGNEPYVYTYDWDAQFYPEGPYPLMARVWDPSRNASSTPVRIVYVEHPD